MRLADRAELAATREHVRVLAVVLLDLLALRAVLTRVVHGRLFLVRRVVVRGYLRPPSTKSPNGTSARRLSPIYERCNRATAVSVSYDHTRPRWNSPLQGFCSVPRRVPSPARGGWGALQRENRGALVSGSAVRPPQRGCGRLLQKPGYRSPTRPPLTTTTTGSGGSLRGRVLLVQPTDFLCRRPFLCKAQTPGGHRRDIRQVRRHGDPVEVRLNGESQKVWPVLVGNGIYGTDLFSIPSRASLHSSTLDLRSFGPLSACYSCSTRFPADCDILRSSSVAPRRPLRVETPSGSADVAIDGQVETLKRSGLWCPGTCPTGSRTRRRCAATIPRASPRAPSRHSYCEQGLP